MPYLYAVMGNELDKIEKSGIEIAQHPRISQPIGLHLQEEVKVRHLSYWCPA